MCHTAVATLDVLRPIFEDHIISRRADVDSKISKEAVTVNGLQFIFEDRIIGAAIWHRWTIICGMPSKISVTPTSRSQLTL